MAETKLDALREELKQLTTGKEPTYKSAEEVLEVIVELIKLMRYRHPEAKREIQVGWRKGKQPRNLVYIQPSPATLVEFWTCDSIEDAKMQLEEWNKLQDVCKEIDGYQPSSLYEGDEGFKINF